MPQIEVTFDLDANGILTVSARDKATGKQQQITITASSGLSKDEVDRMVKEAEAHAAEDSRRRQEIEVRNQTDALVYSTEKMLAEHGDKLTDVERGQINQALTEAKDALESSDVDRITRAQEALQRASGVIAEAMGRQTASSGAQSANPGQGQGPGAAEGEVVDAEIVE